MTLNPCCWLVNIYWDNFVENVAWIFSTDWRHTFILKICFCEQNNKSEILINTRFIINWSHSMGWRHSFQESRIVCGQWQQIVLLLFNKKPFWTPQQQARNEKNASANCSFHYSICMYLKNIYDKKTFRRALFNTKFVKLSDVGCSKFKTNAVLNKRHLLHSKVNLMRV